MRILIVDDNANKVKEIKNIFKDINDIQLKAVTCINDCAYELRTQQYQMMILDMCLPLDFGSDIEKDGGLQLIKMIQKDTKLHAPATIIVLTAYDDTYDKYKAEIESASFNIIKYNDATVEWKKKIKDKTVYRLRTESNRHENRKYNYDVAIITAVEVECQAVKELSEDWTLISVEGDSSKYYETVWNSEGKSYRIIHGTLTQMGMVAAATLTTKIIYNFAPRYIIMPGIAAGTKMEHEFGDIIIPKQVQDYCSGKYTTPSTEDGEKRATENPIEFFVPTSSGFPTDSDIINQVSLGCDGIMSKIHSHWPMKEKYKVPRIRTGFLATGDSVVQNETIISSMVKNHMRQAEGLDMEAYGVYYAANHAISPKPIPVCMKAFSDFANKDKSDEHQKYAAYVSANFVKYFVTNILKNISV